MLTYVTGPIEPVSNLVNVTIRGGGVLTTNQPSGKV